MLYSMFRTYGDCRLPEEVECSSNVHGPLQVSVIGNQLENGATRVVLVLMGEPAR